MSTWRLFLFAVLPSWLVRALGLLEDKPRSHWLEPAGLDRAYAELVWQGVTGSDAPDAPEALNEEWISALQARLREDGLEASFERVWNGPYADYERDKDFIILGRLQLPDGTMPPDPHLLGGQRAEVRRLLEQGWGGTLERARRPFAYQPPHAWPHRRAWARLRYSLAR